MGKRLLEANLEFFIYLSSPFDLKDTFPKAEFKPGLSVWRVLRVTFKKLDSEYLYWWTALFIVFGTLSIKYER